MNHVQDRIGQRASGATADGVWAAVQEASRACAQRGIADAAIRVWRASAKHASDDGSNGECGILIVRGGQPATFMWRRASQPHNRSAYRVDRILCMRGTCDAHTGHR